MIGRSSRPEVFCKKDVLRNFVKFTGKHLCQSIFFNKVAGLSPEACNFIKKETLAQVFSCGFCEISKNTFSYRTSPVAVSGWGQSRRYEKSSTYENHCHISSFKSPWQFLLTKFLYFLQRKKLLNI